MSFITNKKIRVICRDYGGYTEAKHSEQANGSSRPYLSDVILRTEVGIEGETKCMATDPQEGSTRW